MGNIIQQLSRTLPENQHYIDLSGPIQAQGNYLKTLSSQTNDPNLTSKVTNIQTGLDQLNADFTKANATSSQVLDNQQKMMDIVDTEKSRLLQKKQNIDNALDGRRRAALLNESYRQRYFQYLKMIIAFVITLVIYVILVLLSRTFTFIPSVVFDLIYVLLFAAGFFTIYFMYLDVASRDKMYFDQIDLDGPSILSPDQISKDAKDSEKSGNLLGTINLSSCIGNNCCSTGTVWDASNSVCVIPSSLLENAIVTAATSTASTSTSGFTTLSTVYYLSDKAKPNSPSETVGYAFV
jgi:hypothetical protein